MPTLPRGLACVASATRQAGHQVTVVDLMFSSNVDAIVRDAIAELEPQVVGVSVRNIDDQNALAPSLLVAKAADEVSSIRAHCAAPIVLGGAGYSLFPTAALQYLQADLGIQGEGEAAFPALLHQLEHGGEPTDVPGVYRRLEDGSVASGPPPRRTTAREMDVAPELSDYLPAGHDPANPMLWVPLQTRRGCALDCSYCSTPTIEGRRLRSRPLPSVIDELTRIAGAGLQQVYVVDNTFNLPPDYASSLCQQLAEAQLGLRWRGIFYPRKTHTSLVAAMALSGCTEVSLGFESGAEPVLRAMNKRFDAHEARQVNTQLADHGIRRTGFLLLGGPGETLQTVEQSLEFVDGLDLDALKLTVGLRIYPHSPLAATAVEDGVIQPTDDLLQPRFYLADDLRQGIIERVERYRDAHSNCLP